MENREVDMEEIGNDRLSGEDIVEMDASHFDQQSFMMELPEEETDSDSDPNNDETVDQSCNLSDSLRNWALTFGVSLVALTALLRLLRFYQPDLPKDARTLLKTKMTYNIEKRCGGLYYYSHQHRTGPKYTQLCSSHFFSLGIRHFYLHRCTNSQRMKCASRSCIPLTGTGNTEVSS